MIELRSPYSITRPVVIAAAQLLVTLGDYASEAAFQSKMRSVAEHVARAIEPGASDVLLVYPEDLGLGLALTPDFHLISDCRTLAEAGRRIAIRHAYSIAMICSRHKTPLARALFIRMSPTVKRVYRDTFSLLAKEFGFYIFGGTAPLADQAAVYNEGHLFGPDGALIYSARKANLVPLEEEAGMNLCRGNPADLTVVELPPGRVGAAICFDAFQTAIISSLVGHGANLLLQPSFNPFPWTASQAEEWKIGLWHAVQNHKGTIGVNPMMVGQLFDVAGEGVSSISIHRDLSPDGSGYLAQASTHDGEDLLLVRLVP